MSDMGRRNRGGGGDAWYAPNGTPAGSIWYVDPTTGQMLPLSPGAAGKFLQTNGAGAAPSWETPSVSGGSAAVWAMAKSTSQTLTNNTLTLVTFDTSVIDSGSSVIDLANERFVAPTTGLYLVSVSWTWETTVPAAGAANIEIRVNGTAACPLIRVAATATASGGLQGTHPLSLTSGDLVTVFINPGAVTGVTARGNAAAHLRTQFSLVRLT